MSPPTTTAICTGHDADRLRRHGRAFIALLWTRDRHHSLVRAQYERLRAERARLVTSDPVIAETATRLRYDAGLRAARTFASIVREATDAATLAVRESDADFAPALSR